MLVDRREWYKKPVWWMRVDINWLLSSISAFLTELKRIQTPHSLFWEFGADKTLTTLWSGDRVQVWVKVWAPAGHLAITPEGYSRRQSKVLTAKSMAKLLGQRSGTAWAGRTGEIKHRAFPSQRQSLRAATCSLEENLLPLLRYWLSSSVNKVLMLCRYRAATSHFFSSCKMKFSMEIHGIQWLARSCCQAKPRPSLRSIFRSFIGVCLIYDIGTKQHVPNWILCKAADLNRRPVREKGVYSYNSTATSDGGAQKLGNDVWHDYELIVTKVCSQFNRKWNVTFEGHVVPQ